MLRTAHNPLPGTETTIASLSPNPREKREALEEVLQSTTFVRADQLRNFLRYICEMEIAGRASELCEFRIGIEAFGRPADYSPIEDGIVRRRAVSLREKMQEVYATDLVDARIRIDLPKGRYVPRFVRVEPESPIEVVPSPVMPIEHVVGPALAEPIEQPVFLRPAAKVLWFAAGLVVGALVCAALFLVLRSQPWSTPRVSAAAPPVVPTADVALPAASVARPVIEPGVVYLAAAKPNTLSGRTAVASCSWCFGGNRVRYIGGKPKNFVVINDIIVSRAGNYEMVIYYVLDGSRTFFISVNDGPYIGVPLKGKNWLESTRFSMTVSLNAGSNHIKFSGGSYAPDLDHLVIR
jgi:hypothetical protein